MAFDPGLARTLREALPETGVTEQKMFGGLCFLLHGHMVAGVHKRGAMVRVGAPHFDAALALPGITPMRMTGRPMKGIVDCTDAAMDDAGIRDTLVQFALSFVKSLPAK